MSDNVLLEKASDGVLPPMSKVGNLKHFGAECNDDTGTDKKYKSEGTPNDTVDTAVEFSDLFEYGSCLLIINKIKTNRRDAIRKKKNHNTSRLGGKHQTLSFCLRD